MHLAFSDLFNLNALTALRSMPIMQSQSVYCYSFESSDPVPFKTEMLLQTGIHPLNCSPLIVNLAFARRTVSPEVSIHTQQHLLFFALVRQVRNQSPRFS